MNFKSLTIAFGLIVGGALVPKPAEAALPCSDCQQIFAACLAAGNSSAYCDAHWPSGCHGCPPYVANATAPMDKQNDPMLKPKANLVAKR